MKMFSEVPSASNLQLRFPGALGLALLSTADVVLSISIAVAHAAQSAPAQYVATSAVRLVITIMSAGAFASYILVSYRAPRPRLLHVYGLLLFIAGTLNAFSALAEILDHKGFHDVAWLIFGSVNAIWTIYRCGFTKVLTEKLLVLGPPAGRCENLELWGGLLMVFVSIVGLSGAILWILSAGLLFRGAPREDVIAAASPFPPEDLEISVEENTAINVFVQLAGIGACGFLVVAPVYMAIAYRLTRRVHAALVARGTAQESLTRVRCTLRRHWIGLTLSLATNIAHILINLSDGFNLIGREDYEDVAVALVTLIDTGGDVLGILLLSGIGALVLREDPDAADINSHIRGLLRAAVLTGRADFAFEGQLAATRDRRCVASFPGKYMEEWKALTWLCERQELSTACVFLPKSDPQQRFGKHCPCPETPGDCWCVSLYGEEKPWGCQWFSAWKANIDRAVELGLDLVVVFFPGQAGQGVVDWELLPTADLWDGQGLGGSQKGEVAYLRRRGLNFISEDVDEFRSRLNSKRRGSSASSSRSTTTPG